MLKFLYDNAVENITSSLINLFHYIAEYYENEFVSATEVSGLTLSSSMSYIKTASVMNDVGINI